MAEVVLRNEALPGLPSVIDVPVGEYVPQVYQDAGWVIDTATDPMDARREASATQEQNAETAEQAAASFVPTFPPAVAESDDAPPQGDPIDLTAQPQDAAPDAPAEQSADATPDQTVQPAEPVNTTQE